LPLTLFASLTLRAPRRPLLIGPSPLEGPLLFVAGVLFAIRDSANIPSAATPPVFPAVILFPKLASRPQPPPVSPDNGNSPRYACALEW
jgi:hypothetical protein